MRDIVIINGVGGVGKDSFVSRFYDVSGIPTCNISTIQEAERILFALEGVLNLKQERELKTDLYRSVLHDIKNMLVKYGDRPFKQTAKRIQELRDLFPGNVIFVHCREGAEISKLVDYYGEQCITVLVERKVPVANNPADRMLDKYFGYNMIIEEFDLNKMDEYSEKLKGLIYGPDKSGVDNTSGPESSIAGSRKAI